MRKIKRLCGLFICCCVVVTSSVTAFAAEKVKEPFANWSAYYKNKTFIVFKYIQRNGKIYNGECH